MMSREYRMVVVPPDIADMVTGTSKRAECVIDLQGTIAEGAQFAGNTNLSLAGLWLAMHGPDRHVHPAVAL
jgi:hypothetical protein